jgi:CheY-like chemotaxis protein/HPt (histidine-containing phosphotransfer) domain-containing protein
LLEKMGSTLCLESEPSQGSIFSFILQVEPAGGMEESAAIPGRAKRVLVVDDNSSARSVIGRILAHRGIEYETAVNGIEALEKMSGPVQYDALLIDFGMPFMDGLAVVRSMQNLLHLNPEQQRIIVMHDTTADAAFHRDCQNLGVTRKLEKPIRRDNLLSSLTETVTSESRLKNDMPGPVTLQGDDACGKEAHTILIAEDSPVNMLLARTILLKNIPGCRIIEAQDGATAVNLFKHHHPDLVLMDIQMPELDGYGAAAGAIRKMEAGGSSHVPIIALTASAIEGERQRCIASGMDDYITKPVTLHSLNSIVNEYLTRCSSLPGTAAREKSSSPAHFDMDKLKKRLGLDESTLLQVISLSRENLPHLCSSLAESITKKDFSGVKAAAHKLYGSAMSMCFTAMGEKTKVIDSMTEPDFSRLDILSEEIMEELEILKQELSHVEKTGSVASRIDSPGT